MKPLGNDWDEIIKEEMEKDYYKNLRQFLKLEYFNENKSIYPPMNEIFSALVHTSYTNTKVVILGQDPYINEGEAHGMAFSVKPHAKTPPSLKNVFKELSYDIGAAIPNNGYLIKWADQGVLLLNTILTVEAKKSKSHSKKGWEQFTTSIIKTLNNKDTPVVFLLWGKDAKTKIELITNPIHKILTAAHPSPLAGGRFFGCRHFSKTNEFLRQSGMEVIDWQIENV